MVRIPHREEEGLHELMLVTLQPIEALLLCAAAERHRLLQLVALLGETDVETGGRRGAFYREAVRIMEHTLSGLGIIRIRIMVFGPERLVIDDDAAEGQEFAELRHYVCSLEAVHKRLVFDIDHRHHRILQTSVLPDFDGLEEAFIAVHQALVRILGTELRIRELREQKLLLLRLPGIGDLPRDRASGKRSEGRSQERRGRNAEYQ